MGALAQKGSKLCIIEVGTAEGKGTTHALTEVLGQYVGDVGGDSRDYVIHTYEGFKDLFQKARKVWGDDPKVVMHNKLVMTPKNLRDFVIANIRGPPGPQWPGTGYYENYYGGTEKLIVDGKMGGWFEHPGCKADLILVDGTRFTHAGILATLLEHGDLWDRDTVWLVENDGGKEASEQEILESIWRLRGLTVEQPGKYQDHP